MRDIRAEIQAGTFKVSQSRLKHLIGDNPSKFLMPRSSGTSQASVRGLAVETLLWEPLKYTEKFETCPSFGTSKVFTAIDNIYETLEEKKLLKDIPSIVLEKAREAEVGGSTWTDERIIQEIETKGEDYYNFLWSTTASDKLCISPETEAISKELVKGILNVEATRNLCTRKPGEEFLLQEQIHFTYSNVDCICIPDLIKINHDEKIIDIIELKTTEYSNWRKKAKEGRWDIQGAFEWQSVSECGKWPGYKVNNPYFLIANISRPQKPQIFQMSPRDLIAGELGLQLYRTVSFNIVQGGLTMNHGVTIEGFYQLIERYKFHRDMDLWDYRKEFYSEDKEDMDLWTS